MPQSSSGTSNSSRQSSSRTSNPSSSTSNSSRQSSSRISNSPRQNRVYIDFSQFNSMISPPQDSDPQPSPRFNIYTDYLSRPSPIQHQAYIDDYISISRSVSANVISSYNLYASDPFFDNHRSVQEMAQLQWIPRRQQNTRNSEESQSYNRVLWRRYL